MLLAERTSSDVKRPIHFCQATVRYGEYAEPRKRQRCRISQLTVLVELVGNNEDGEATLPC
jgi:hypothetical protein